MIQLDSTKSKKICFNLDISGSENAPESAKLVFEKDGIELSIQGTIDEGQIIFEVPPVNSERFPKSIVNEKRIKGHVGVIFEGKEYRPWDDEFEINKPVSIKAEAVNENKDKKPLTIKVDNVIVEEEKVEEKVEEKKVEKTDHKELFLKLVKK